jgi:hypothetical protein
MTLSWDLDLARAEFASPVRPFAASPLRPYAHMSIPLPAHYDASFVNRISTLCSR